MMAVLSSTLGDDIRNGTDDRDTFAPSAGDDKINSRGGDDRLEGGEGNDLRHGGSGADDLFDAGDGLFGDSNNDRLSGGNDLDDLDLSVFDFVATQPPPIEPIPQLTVRLTQLQVQSAAEDGVFDRNAEWVLSTDASFLFDPPTGMEGLEAFRRFTFRNGSVDDGDSFSFNQQLFLSEQFPLGSMVNLFSFGTEEDPVADDSLPTSNVTLTLNSKVENLLVRTTAEGGEDFGAFLETPLNARYAQSWQIDFGAPPVDPFAPPVTPLPPVDPFAPPVTPDLGQLTVRLTRLEVGEFGAGEDPRSRPSTGAPALDDAEWELDIEAAASGGGRDIRVDFPFRDDSVRGGDDFNFENDELVLTGQFPLGTSVTLRASGIEDDPVFDDELPESDVSLTLNSEVENLSIRTSETEGVDVGVVPNPGPFGYNLSWEVDFVFA